MSFDPSQENPSKRSKKPVVIAAFGVLALVAAGGVVLMKADSDTASPVISASETGVIETISPAAGEENAAAPASDVTSGDPVVAKIGNDEVKRSEVLAFIATLPEQVRQQMPMETMFPLALDQVLNNRIIGEKAETAKLESDPEVSKMVAEAKEQIVRNVYVERELSKAVSEKELQDAYAKMLESLQSVEEVHARHILLKDEAAARDVIAKLESGTSFEELAKQSTDGPTAANGGDLGFFTKTDMIPEFSEVAFKLTPGTYTKEPVKSQFGYHVIKVEEKRQRPAPKFEEVKPQLESQMRREKLNSILEGWQKEAQITKFDMNGDPVAAAPAAAPEAADATKEN